MAAIDLRRCNDTDAADPKKMKLYINNLIDQLSFILHNLDEENVTDKFMKDIKKKNKEDSGDGEVQVTISKTN